ncbi:MAG: enolase C-terminal domain-like protein [Pseudomonadota bacterium]
MKIDSFEIRAAKVPMREPHRTASVVVEICPVVTITVRTDEGMRGDGIVFGYNAITLKSIHALAEALTPLLKGAVLDPSKNSAAISAKFKLLGLQGLVGMVLSGIDMALWDAHARALEKPLYALLGNEAKPVKPYGNVGYDGVKGSADGAERCAKDGFLGVKAKIGYPSVEEDIDVIRAMRSAVGPDVALMVDYNQTLDLQEAKRRILALRDEDLTWIEEPVYSHDFANYVTLQDETGSPLQAGENWWGPADFRIAFDSGVKGMVMPDAQKCGGVTGWMAIAEMAEAHKVEVSSHLWPEVSAQLLSVTPTAGWLEYADWFNPIVTEPLKVRNGYVDIDGVIGTGVRLDDDALSAYAL